MINTVLKPKGKAPTAANDDDGDAVKHKGRRANATFPFDAEHPKAMTHVQRMRSKIVIPEMVGSPPTCPLEFNKRNKTKCRVFARFILTNFKSWRRIKPWAPTSTEGSFGWIGMCDFLQELALPDAPWINRSILRIIENFRFGVKSNYM